MNLGYMIVLMMASIAYYVTNVPTEDGIVASFAAAQRYYTSSAYDQSIEECESIIAIESPFIDVDNIAVDFIGLSLPIKDAARYRIGLAYHKMANDQLTRISFVRTPEEVEEASILALEYAELGTDNLKELQNATNVEILKAMAQNSIMEIWYDRRDFDRVIAEGRELIDNYPRSRYVQDALYNIGWAFYENQAYDQAIVNFQELVKRFPTGVRADRSMYQIGESYFELKNYTEAAKIYQQLVDKLGITRLTQREIERIQRDKIAGITDETVLELAAKAQIKVGACFAAVEDYDNAAAAYRRVAEIFRFDRNLIAEAYQRLADMYFEKGDFELSIQAYQDAIDRGIDAVFSAQMQIAICVRYFENERYHDSIRAYQHYINTYSDVAFRAGADVDEAYFWLGRSYQELGNDLIRQGETELGVENLEQAIITFNRLFELIPDTDWELRIRFYESLANQRIGTDEGHRRAIAINQNLITDFEDNPYKENCYMIIARSYQALEEYETALTYFERIFEEFPETVQADIVNFEVSSTYRLMEREGDGIPYLLRVGTSDSRLFTVARLLAGQYYFAQGQNQQLIEAVSFALENKHAIESEHRLAQLLMMRGISHRVLGMNEEAIEDFNSAYDFNNPETREMAAVQRSSVYIATGQYQRAERDLRELANSELEDVRRDARLQLAYISVRQDRTDVAINAYLELYEAEEDIAEKLGYLRNIITLSNAAEDFDLVHRYTDMMINQEDARQHRVEGSDTFFAEEALYSKAVAYEQQGNFYRALEILERGLQEYPNSGFSREFAFKPGLYYLTFEALGAEPDAIDIAAEYFERYVELFPNTDYTVTAHYYWAFCLYNGRRFEEAIRAFNSFVQNYTVTEFLPDVLFFRAESHYNLGNSQLALNGFNDLISRFPRHERASEALFASAWTLMDLNRESDAIDALKQYVQNYPRGRSAPQALFSVGDYYFNMQEYDTAIEMYQRVQDDFPASEVAERIPGVINEINDTVAYLEYEIAFELFERARQTRDSSLFREAAEKFEEIANKYPGTSSEVGALSNGGFCYEQVGNWRKAVELFNRVIRLYEEGANVSLEAFNFADSHKRYIEANFF